MKIRPAQPVDMERVYQLFQAVIDEKIYFPYDRHTTRAEIESSWVNLKYLVYVAEIENGKIAGAYIVKANQAGYGGHVANAAYMVDGKYRGRGIGRQLGEHSLLSARAAGFRAMQYNLVVSTNKGAIKVWKDIGFEIIGTVPEGFLHEELGYVDAYVMFKKL